MSNTQFFILIVFLAAIFGGFRFILVGSLVAVLGVVGLFAASWAAESAKAAREAVPYCIYLGDDDQGQAIVVRKNSEQYAAWYDNRAKLGGVVVSGPGCREG